MEELSKYRNLCALRVMTKRTSNEYTGILVIIWKCYYLNRKQADYFKHKRGVLSGIT